MRGLGRVTVRAGALVWNTARCWNICGAWQREWILLLRPANKVIGIEFEQRMRDVHERCAVLMQEIRIKRLSEMTPEELVRKVG